MNIWLVNHYAILPQQAGGTRHYVLARELVERGHQVTIIASSFDHTTRQEMHLREGEASRLEVVNGVRFLWIRTPPYRGNSPKRLWNMMVFARKVLGLQATDLGGPPDVVLGSSPHLFAAWAAERIARRYRVPFVLEVRDLWPQSLVDLGGFSENHPFVQFLERIERSLYQRACRIITLLPGAGGHVAEKGGDISRITWIPNGVDLSLVPAPTPPPSNGEFTFLYAGAHGLANRLDFLLDAIQYAQNMRPDLTLRFRFVGDGPEKPALIERSRKLGIQNVTFEDPVPKSEIYHVMSAANAFVVVLHDTPLYRWGISVNKIYDYLAMARPIALAAPDSIYNNPVKEAGAGLTASAGDPKAYAESLIELANMPAEELWRIGLKGRKYVEENHDFKRLADRLEGVLEDALEE